MKQKAFPGVSSYRDRHNVLRWRYRKNGLTVQLGKEFGSTDFIRKYTAAVQGERLERRATGKVLSGSRPGSLSAIIEGWLESVEFKQLGATTQRTYLCIARRLGKKHGDKPVASLLSRHIKQFMADKIETPESANSELRVWRFALDYAVEQGMVPVNVARVGVRKLRATGPGFHTWTEEEITAFYAKYPLGTLAHRAMTLMLYTATSRADAVALGPGNIVNGRLRYSRQKMKSRAGMVVDMPVHPRLAEMLETCPTGDTFLITEAGTKRSAAGLGNSMRAWCDTAGLVECTSHGLRKACARRLIEAGCTPHEMMAITGHKTLAEAQRYAETYNRTAAADRAIGKHQ